MSFNPIEYLSAGKTDFVYQLTSYDKDHLIKRIRENANRNQIINGFINILKDETPYLCYEIIYDIEEFDDIAYYLLTKYIKIKNISIEKLPSILKNTSYKEKLLTIHLEEIMSISDEHILCIIKYLLDNTNDYSQLIEFFSKNDNLHIRYLFMYTLLKDYYQLMPIIYDDITKYFTTNYLCSEQLCLFTNYLEDCMAEENLSDLAILALKHDNFQLYNEIKIIILANYTYNSLAKKLHETYQDNNNEAFIKEIENNINTLFATSLNHRMWLYKKFSKVIKEELLTEFKNRIKYFSLDAERKNDWRIIYPKDYDRCLYNI